MSVVTMKQLLEVGAHFGHQTRRWNPKMAEYIYQERNGVYIIDLQKTVKKMEEAYKFVKETVTDGEEILFVGTKKQAQDSVKEEAERCSMYYVNARWLGGMLTNFNTIKKRIDRLNKLREMEETGYFEVLPKKEVITLRAEMERLIKYLGGISNMTRLPGAIFIVDPRKERIAILEARKLGIPVVAIVDTNCDPDEVDYVIPGNDDAIRAVKFIASKIADAVIEARQGESFAEAGPANEYGRNDESEIIDYFDEQEIEAQEAEVSAAPEAEAAAEAAAALAPEAEVSAAPEAAAEPAAAEAEVAAAAAEAAAEPAAAEAE